MVQGEATIFLDKKHSLPEGPAEMASSTSSSSTFRVAESWLLLERMILLRQGGEDFQDQEYPLQASLAREELCLVMRVQYCGTVTSESGF